MKTTTQYLGIILMLAAQNLTHEVMAAMGTPNFPRCPGLPIQPQPQPPRPPQLPRPPQSNPLPQPKCPQPAGVMGRPK